MKTVKVRQQALLGKLRENLRKHEQDYREAMEGYQAEAVRQCQHQLEAFRANQHHQMQWSLLIPVSHEEDYKKVIAMLEMSVDETIDLSSSEFDAYVRDCWQWKGGFEMSKSLYAARR